MLRKPTRLELTADDINELEEAIEQQEQQQLHEQMAAAVVAANQQQQTPFAASSNNKQSVEQRIGYTAQQLNRRQNNFQ